MPNLFFLRAPMPRPPQWQFIASQLKGMWDECNVWPILVAVISMSFLLKNSLLRYIALGVGAVLLSTMLFLKTRQPVPQGPARSSETQGTSGPSGFFHKAHNFVLHNPIMTYVQGEDQTPRIMELLSNNVIIGAAHDDSARTYPPRCHPGTRIQILERLNAWFYNINRVKSFFWLSGPAGVGKSAVMQTFAEFVKQPMASVFVSRPNKRNDPNRIFTTIAYQLAVHMDAYRDYVVDRLVANPHLLKKSIQVQFQIFIIEPFGEKNIGAGGPPIAILLDGLDEVDGIDTQRDIIRRIRMFTREYPAVPLAWVVSSRPERHISDTFNEVTVQDSHESEFIPTDSTDACQDVERFLRDSFDTIRHDFPFTTLRNWPEETALVKLAHAASGLFIFAETAIRFIRDPDHGNPIPRLQLVLSVIDRLEGVSISEQPFALLDKLYTEILSQIPPGMWPTTERLLRLALFIRSTDEFQGICIGTQARTLRGMAMILQLDRHTVYAAFNKCFSTLGIPSWNKAHHETLTFLHASFADYLIDPKRSGQFHISLDGIKDDVLLSYLNLWHKHFGSNSTLGRNLVNEYDNDTQEMTQEQISKFNKGIFEDVAGTLLFQIIERHKPQPVQLPVLQPKCLTCLDSLRKVNMITLCNSEYVKNPIYGTHNNLFSFVEHTFASWREFSQVLSESGILRQLSFKDMNFDQDIETYAVTKSIMVLSLESFQFLVHYGPATRGSTGSLLMRPPNLPVLICGVVPGGRISLFRGDDDGTKYYIVPYSES